MEEMEFQPHTQLHLRCWIQCPELVTHEYPGTEQMYNQTNLIEVRTERPNKDGGNVLWEAKEPRWFFIDETNLTLKDFNKRTEIGRF